MVAGIALVLLSPVMLVIALLIRTATHGPAFYTQTRVGIDRRSGRDRRRNRTGSQGGRRRRDLGGKPFTIFKFRTMDAGACRNGDEVWATPDDPRVTRVGRFLRLYRLDELPQLINVLNGDMNVVGPRPEQPHIFARLREEIDGYQARQRERPGITGWAQINHSYDQTVDDVRRKLEFDLEYINRRSFNEDFRIMMRTLPVILFRRGAW